MEFNAFDLYETERLMSEESDADAFISKITSLNLTVHAVIVDDYRLGRSWERKIYSTIRGPLIAFDDVARHHYCDLIIDSRWEGEKTLSRYNDKTLDNAIMLLGPSYTMVGAEYHKPSYINCEKRHKQRVVISIGGGGGLSHISDIINEFLNIKENFENVEVYVVVGPYTSVQPELSDLSNSHKNIFLYENHESIYPLLKEADLFVGAAGGTLYEALILQVPCLTFSISKNQENERRYLEDLGHYFHLGFIDDCKVHDIAQLMHIMLEKMVRLKKLYSIPPRIVIDNLGVDRVCSHVTALIKGYDQPDVFSYPLVDEVLTQDQSYDFCAVNDQMVNKYLEARNLEKNLRNMTIKTQISHLAHYIWWLNDNRRESYVLKKGGIERLFIWHQVVTFSDKKVLIGGWFVSSDDCGPIDVFTAMEKQLNLTDDKYSKIPWVAVIHRFNKFVQLMNRRFGFFEISKSHSLYHVAKQSFPSASENDFLFFARA